jgi:hypothetical protein
MDNNIIIGKAAYFFLDLNPLPFFLGAFLAISRHCSSESAEGSWFLGLL